MTSFERFMAALGTLFAWLTLGGGIALILFVLFVTAVVLGVRRGRRQ